MGARLAQLYCNPDTCCRPDKLRFRGRLRRGQHSWQAWQGRCRVGAQERLSWRHSKRSRRRNTKGEG